MKVINRRTGPHWIPWQRGSDGQWRGTYVDIKPGSNQLMQRSLGFLHVVQCVCVCACVCVTSPPAFQVVHGPVAASVPLSQQQLSVDMGFCVRVCVRCSDIIFSFPIPILNKYQYTQDLAVCISQMLMLLALQLLIAVFLIVVFSYDDSNVQLVHFISRSVPFIIYNDKNIHLYSCS